MKSNPLFQFNFGHLDDFSTELEGRAVFDGFFMKYWIDHIAALSQILLESQAVLSIFKNYRIDMKPDASTNSSLI